MKRPLMAVREMRADEIHIRIEYFHRATDAELIVLGVDRARLPSPRAWQESYEEDRSRSLEERSGYALLWMLDHVVVGFSTADRIVFGQQACHAPAHPGCRPASPGTRNPIRRPVGQGILRDVLTAAAFLRAERPERGPEPDVAAGRFPLRLEPRVHTGPDQLPASDHPMGAGAGSSGLVDGGATSERGGPLESGTGRASGWRRCRRPLRRSRPEEGAGSPSPAYLRRRLTDSRRAPLGRTSSRPCPRWVVEGFATLDPRNGAPKAKSPPSEATS